MNDTGKVFFRMDSTAVVERLTTEQLKDKRGVFRFRIPTNVTYRRKDGGLDSARLAELKDSIKNSFRLAYYWPGIHAPRKEEELRKKRNQPGLYKPCSGIRTAHPLSIK
jgi:hypothetical protein